MLHRVLTAMALAVVLSCGAEAHPNYPGLQVVQEHQKPAGAAGGAGKAKKAVHESRSGAKVLSIARRDIGRNPTGWKYLWCAVAVNHWFKKAGIKGSGSATARSFAKVGKGVPLRNARPGDIVVLARKGGGHVGVAAAPPKAGKIVLVSGNSGGKRGARMVTERAYPMSRVIAVRRVS